MLIQFLEKGAIIRINTDIKAYSLRGYKRRSPPGTSSGMSMPEGLYLKSLVRF